VNAGDILFAYVYLDPENPPSEIMLQWNNGNWEHRAFWGANNISYGIEGTASRAYMGPLPSAGQWVRLQVPASQVGLEGATINGMAFSQYDGRATWDRVGKTGSSLSSGGSNSNGSGTSTNSVPGTSATITAWVDDSLPAGALPGAEGGDVWNWINSNPSPVHGNLANQSTIAAGLHQHFFSSASQTLNLGSGEVLFAYVYLDPSNLPSEIMLQWNDGTWEHRAYWGANNIVYGLAGTTSLLNMGPLPAAGQWVLLQVPASQVGLEGATLNGMAFSQFDGRATWDYAGKASSLITSVPPPNSGTTNAPGGTNTFGGGNTNSSIVLSNAIAWVEDSLPAGAVGDTDGGDAWNWIGNNPTPFSGRLANQSTIGAGLHQHYFTSAARTLTVNAGDVMFAYVYLDPNNLPSEIMLQWDDGTWEHRAFWGADNIKYGKSDTPSRAYMGPLPPAGQWTLLQVPANEVGLEGSTVSGMAFSQYYGRATWDYVGKATAVLTNAPAPSLAGLPQGGTNSVPAGATNILPAFGTTNVPPSPATNYFPVAGTNSPVPAFTNSAPGVSLIDYLTP